MQAARIRQIIAIVAIVGVLGLIIVLALYASTLKIYKQIDPYANHYDSVVASVSNGTGVYQEREYYAATSTDLAIPTNGQLLINPIKQSADENRLPTLQTAVYLITNDYSDKAYIRLSNSKRLEQRSSKYPEVANVGLAFSKAAALAPDWTSAILYTSNNRAELIDSALLLGPATNNPANWTNNFSIYLLDGALTKHSAAILPGVNILNQVRDNNIASGALYTNRAIAIGSTPSAEQDRYAATALQEASQEAPAIVPTQPTVNTNMSITGTDILLVAPEGQEKISTIAPPLYDPAKDPPPTTRIASQTGTGNRFSISGGVLAIGKDCNLTVSQDANGQGTVDMELRSLLVDGGTLILADCQKNSIKISNDIHVRNGGHLIIGDGIQINGNIFAYGDGRVEVQGSFELNGNQITVDDQKIPGGIYVFANNSFDQNGDILGSGSFKASVLYMIDGSDGSSYILRSHVINFLSNESFPGYPLMYSEYSCLDSTQGSYICQHFGPVTGLMAPDITFQFSEDSAILESFSTKTVSNL